MTRKLRTTLALVASLLLLAGCSDDAAAPPPVLGDDPSVSEEPTPTETPSPTSEPEGEFDDEGHVAMRGDIKAPGAEQQGAVDAWLSYWQVRMDAFAVPEADPAAIGAVASGDAASQIVSYVRYLEQRRLHTEGDLLFDVSDVKVKGDGAVLQSCVVNRSIDRRANGRAAEPLTPFYEFEGHLVRVSDTWAVTRVIDTGGGPC